MMDSIQPLHDFEDNPFVGLASAKPVDASHEAKPAAFHGVTIEPNRMAKEPDYYIATMKWLYEKAKTYYDTFQYAYAHELFQQFFKYIRFYRFTNRHPIPPGVNFYPALFEFSWLMEIQGHRHEAQKLLNQELMRLMEASLTAKPPKMQPIRDLVKTLQEENRFPSVAHLAIEVPPEDLLRLAQQFAAAGEPGMANAVARHAEVRHQLGVSRTQAYIHRLEQREEAPARALQPHGTLPSGFSHLGVPLAPVSSITPEDMHVIQPKTTELEFHVDRVEPVYALNKDPREQNPRGGKRQRMNRPASKRNKSSRGPRTSPRITL